MSRPHALTIAGSDPSGGAGIQADLKTFHALDVYGMAVITSLTAQNTRGVTGIENVSPGFVREAARLVGACASPVSVLSGAGQVTTMAYEMPDGSLEVAVKSKVHVYADAEIDVGREIAELRLLTPFPVVTVTPSGSRFAVRVPPGGITVLAVDV